MQNGELFSNAFVSHGNLGSRLVKGFRDAWTEFKQDPGTFIQNLIRKDPITGRRKAGMRFGLAVALVFYSLFGFCALVLWSGSHRVISDQTGYTVVSRLFGPGPSQKIEIARNSDSGDGGSQGGGGHDQPNPVSIGSLPKPSLADQIIAPTTRPQLTPPELAVPMTLQIDPRALLPHDDSIIGLPNGVVGPPSDGLGSHGGIGNGDGGGIGDHKGPGVDNGTPGPGGIGRERAGAYDIPPVALNRPHPNYTEEARQNKVQGIVMARVLVGADGLVKQVSIRQGLPGGLNEEAIRAAYLMRFSPAAKSGRPVAAWVTLEIEFNLR